VGVGGWWRSSLFAWAEREIGRESWARGANERGEVGEQGASLGRGWRTRGRGRVHGGEIVGERLETTDRWGRWDRERERGRVGAGGGGEWRRQLWPTGQRERRRAQACADRRGPPVRHKGRTGARGG
jgi:hypothetical protein